MKRLALLTAVALLAAAPAAAQETSSDGVRFDVQSFKPSGTPRDLVMVNQSSPIANMSFAVGLVMDFALDPLVLVQQDSEAKYLSVVGNRLQLNGVASVGLFNWLELGLSMPLVLSQSSDNLEALGTEGPIKSSVPGDLRASAKVALWRRDKEEEGGFGAAATLGVAFPTGVQEAFSSDGELTLTPGLVLDYRFKGGLLLALNGGYWSRPVGEFNGLKLGPMATFGAATEVPLVRDWGIHAVGAFYGAASLMSEVGEPRAVPAELMLGLRWYSDTGVTLTVGGGGGCGCSFSAPTFRFFASILWTPSITEEHRRMQEYKRPKPPPPPPVDPDSDGVIGERDKCPEVSGPVENGGCPDEDRDKDGIADRIDRCPTKPSPRGRGREGCPLAEIDGDQIVITDQVYFAFNKDEILDESFPVLDEVARVIQENPEFARIRVEGHTDSVASQQYNLDLSRRRAASVERYLSSKGVETRRLTHQGFGMRRPIADNATEEGRQLNRRVEFHIERSDARMARGGEGGKVEPAKATVVSVWAQGNRIQTVEPLRFVADAEGVAPESIKLLEGVARLIRKDAVIDRVRIEVRAEKPGPEALTLARRRAATLESFLIEQGVERKRVRAVAVFGNFGEPPGITAVPDSLVDIRFTLRTDTSQDPFGKNPVPTKQ